MCISFIADGHHKLIRWRIVTHGGIDGYSRMIVYLCASTNNRASTVHSLFMEAVKRFGLPSRVRSDEGGENVMVVTLNEKLCSSLWPVGRRKQTVHSGLAPWP